jgi:hypothetical protein
MPKRHTKVALLLAAGALGLLARITAGFVAPGTRSLRAPARGPCRTGVAAQKPAEECKVEEENPMNQIKEYGTAGIISYAVWELGFWTVGGAGAVAAFVAATGHMPDFSNQDDMTSVGGEAFIFINGARLLVPLRLGLALSTAPWVRDNVVDKIFPKEECVGASSEADGAPSAKAGPK